VIVAVGLARDAGVSVAVRGGGQQLSRALGLRRRRVRQGEPDRDPDLFWGVRGGGGNFGIVTEFEFRLHRVGPAVLAGPIYWPAEEARALLRFYREWISETPNEIGPRSSFTRRAST
jgi:hypothetical protein